MGNDDELQQGGTFDRVSSRMGGSSPRKPLNDGCILECSQARAVATVARPICNRKWKESEDPRGVCQLAVVRRIRQLDGGG